MKDLQKRVAYLQGLAEGLELDDSKEGKLISEILAVLEDMADEMAGFQEQLADMDDYMDSIDGDLADVEDQVFGDEEEDDEVDADEEDLIDVECPNCHEVVCFDSAILYDDQPTEVTCPVCDAVVFSNEEDFSVEEYEEEETEE